MDWVITHLLDLFSINRTHRAILEPAPSPSSDLVGSVGNAHGQTHGSAIGAYDVQTLFSLPLNPGVTDDLYLKPFLNVTVDTSALTSLPSIKKPFVFFITAAMFQECSRWWSLSNSAL